MFVQQNNSEQDSFSYTSDKKLIVGLGNPGKKYAKTRHNAGFLYVDKIARENNVNMSDKNDFESMVGNYRDNGMKIILAKPQTFMNDSGRAVQKIAKYYDILAKDIYIAHDDLDLDLGKIKKQFAKGPKGHNGLVSVTNSLKTDEYWHIRIGVDNRGEEERKYMTGKDYVLKKLSDEELEVLDLKLSI